MDSPKLRWTWKEGFRFALAWELRFKRGQNPSYPMNSIEKWSCWYLKPLYQALDWASKRLRRPMMIVLLTFFTALIVSIAFYNIPAFIFLGKIFPAKLIRLFFFIYIETVILGMGCRALGRFQNTALMSLWEKNELEPFFFIESSKI